MENDIKINMFVNSKVHYISANPPAAHEDGNPLFSWTANWTKVWDNRRVEDMLVLVNNATRFTVAIYQVKRKDLKNVAEMMRTAISNTLLSINLNPDIVEEYLQLAGEVEFTQNRNRQTASWVAKAGLECAFHVGNEYNGIAKMFSDTVGASANYRIVNCSGNTNEGFYPYKAMINALSELTRKQAYKYRAFELMIARRNIMYKIMIIEDDITIAESLKVYIEKHNYEVFIVRQFEKIMDEFNENKPDLILLDVNLPIYDGFFWCREIRNISSLPIIFISARTGDLEQIYAMDNGADDYIVKPFSLDVVIAKINANIRRAYGDYSNLTKERILSLKDLSLYCESFILKNGDKEVRLTKKEVELLSLFIENHPKVISREELLRALWDDEVFVEENTLNVNITRIRKRLTEVDARFLIESVRGVGYRLVEVQ